MKVISKDNRKATYQGICEAIKLEPSLITGTDCLNDTCDGFCRNCNKCPDNTRTPYVIINGRKHYMPRVYNDFYIIILPDGGISTTDKLTAFYRVISE